MKKDTYKRISLLFLFVILFANVTNGTSQRNNRTQKDNGNNTNHGNCSKGIHIFNVKFDEVSKPFLVSVWILFISLAKILFHKFKRVSDNIPESCLLIVLGVLVGLILKLSLKGGEHEFLSSKLLTADVFFHYLLPPIIFDAGYFTDSKCFFRNIGTILLYAVIGTIANTFLVGASMYGIANTTSVNISFLNSLLFGALISAVDPVAVLAVFEEVQVNEILYMLVFGESILNDAASVVLYRTFEFLPEDIAGDSIQVVKAIISFFVVSVFGTMIGVIFGLFASFITKFTDHVRVIEPIIVFITAYTAYLTAEIFHFSGIMSILFCGVVMKPYVEANISRKSHTTIKYFLKMLASSCEAIIFLFLGITLIQHDIEFDMRFIAWCLFFIFIFRGICIVSLTWLANKFGRLDRVCKVEQLIMTLGGLRGAVAYCLAVLINEDCVGKKLRDSLVTTTLFVIVFTCFAQGLPMKKFVEMLGIKRAENSALTMTEHLNNKVMGFMAAGIEEIIGVHGDGYWSNLMDWMNQKVLRPHLERNPEKILDDALFQEERKIEKKQGLIKDINYPYSPKSCESCGHIPVDKHTENTECDAPVIIVDDPNEFAYLIPDANTIKPRRRYSDASVGLDDGDWEEREHILKGTSKRDTYGNKIPKTHRRHYSYHGSHRSHGSHHHHRSRHHDQRQLKEVKENIEMVEMEGTDWNGKQAMPNEEADKYLMPTAALPPNVLNETDEHNIQGDSLETMEKSIGSTVLGDSRSSSVSSDIREAGSSEQVTASITVDIFPSPSEGTSPLGKDKDSVHEKLLEHVA